MKNNAVFVVEGTVLQPEDVKELLPDPTEEEMKAIADIISSYWNEEYWSEALSYAATVVRGDRKK